MLYYVRMLICSCKSIWDFREKKQPRPIYESLLRSVTLAHDFFKPKDGCKSVKVIQELGKRPLSMLKKVTIKQYLKIELFEF